MRLMFAIFVSIFLAELGDKTQLATLLYATDKAAHPLSVFVAASAALVFATLLAVVMGTTVTKIVSPETLRVAAGIAFIAIGIWTLATVG